MLRIRAIGTLTLRIAKRSSTQLVRLNTMDLTQGPFVACIVHLSLGHSVANSLIR